MSDVRDALSALCRYINSLINAGLTPEHLRLAKYNALDETVAETLRNTLHVLSYHAAREKRGDIDFRNYDTLTAVKLHLAFLQYPATEFYSLSQSNNDCNRDSLIALAWLLGTQDVLTVVLRARLAGGVLGVECSRVDPPEIQQSSIRPVSSIVRSDDQPTNVQLAGILHLNARVNLNLREIGELTRERGSLVSKVHAASVDVTAIQEHRKSTKTNPREIDSQELAVFSSLLRQVIREKLRVLTSAEAVGNEFRNTALDCPSRAHRSQCNDIEAQNWLDDLNARQKREEENLERNRKRLADELERMLKLIPSIIRV
ncbi:hypothetical protein RF55_8662 [Lasius niger]|uniref:Tubulin epsilon and delta complex protein 1 domain-containing protein n=1 Tax=Lasius niger TaxID=67767 RepID=A0A0J7KMI3_LASNI|nr:hypothetical protein RF55_8662 [Lasius niger]